MRLLKAGPEHSDQLIDYYRNYTLPGPISLNFVRQNNFFDSYRLVSDEFATYILVNDDQQIEAVASLVLREGFINGQKQKIGFATDLHVSPTRKAILTWAQNFMPILERECSERNVKYIFSVVAHAHRQAYNAFIRPRSPRRRMPRYYLFRRFDVVTIHGRLPFAPKPLNTIEIRRATKDDQERLAQYVVHKKLQQPIYFCEDDQRFFNYVYRWRGLEVENFLLAIDNSGNIVGCLAAWSPEEIVKVYQQRLTNKGLSFKETLHFLSFFRMARPLGSMNDPLKFKYLTFFYADNPDIFYSLLVNAYENSPRDEFLAYTHYEGHLQSLAPRSFISGHIPCGLYCILPSEQSMPEFLKPHTWSQPPDFEASFF